MFFKRLPRFTVVAFALAAFTVVAFTVVAFTVVGFLSYTEEALEVLVSILPVEDFFLEVAFLATATILRNRAG